MPFDKDGKWIPPKSNNTAGDTAPASSSTKANNWTPPGGTWAAPYTPPVTEVAAAPDFSVPKISTNDRLSLGMGPISNEFAMKSATDLIGALDQFKVNPPAAPTGATAAATKNESMKFTDPVEQKAYDWWGTNPFKQTIRDNVIMPFKGLMDSFNQTTVGKLTGRTGQEMAEAVTMTELPQNQKISTGDEKLDKIADTIGMAGYVLDPAAAGVSLGGAIGSATKKVTSPLTESLLQKGGTLGKDGMLRPTLPTVAETFAEKIVKQGVKAAGTDAAVDYVDGALTPNMESPTFANKFGSSMMAGAGDTVELVGSAAKWMGFENLGNDLQEYGKQTREGHEIPTEEFTWKSLLDPNFYAVNVARTLPTSLSLMPLALLGGTAGGAAAGAAGVGAFGRTVMQAIGASAFATPMEAAMEAGSVYEDMRKKGEPVEKADKAADKTFWGNLALLGVTNAAEFATAFAPKGITKVLDSGGGRIATGAISGGAEEAGQGLISSAAKGEDLTIDPESVTIGAMIGGGMGAMGAVGSINESHDTLQTIQHKVINKLDDQTKAELNEAIDEAKAIGIPQAEAMTHIMNTLAADEKGQGYIQEAVKEVLESSGLAQQAKQKSTADLKSTTATQENNPAAAEPIENLETAQPVSDTTTANEGPDITLSDNQVRIKFSGQVDPAVQKQLQKAKYKYSKREQAWVAPKNANTVQVSSELAGDFTPYWEQVLTDQESEVQRLTELDHEMSPSLLNEAQSMIGKTKGILENSPNTDPKSLALPKATSTSKAAQRVESDKFLRDVSKGIAEFNPTHEVNGIPVEVREFPDINQLGYRYQSTQSQLASNKTGGFLKLDDPKAKEIIKPLNSETSEHKTSDITPEQEYQSMKKKLGGSGKLTSKTKLRQLETMKSFAAEHKIEFSERYENLIQKFKAEVEGGSEKSESNSKKKIKISTERGKQIDAEYAVVHGMDIVVSNDPMSFEKNKIYPQDLQPRDRSRASSEDQINRMVAKLNPEFLGASAKASEGAPIVSEELTTESGNGRMMALQRAYLQKSPSLENYKNWLRKNITSFGLNPSDLVGENFPVLVRIRKTPMNTDELIQFTREANEQSVSALSATEQAKSDADKLTDGMIQLFNPGEEANVLSVSNREFVRAFIKDVIGPSERSRYLDKDGALNQDGVTRIRNAMFARTYGESTAIEKLAESTDNNVRNITNAMLIASPGLVQIKEGVAGGRLYNLDITSDITSAMIKLSDLRDSAQSVNDYFNQGDIFGADLTDEAKNILAIFDGNKRSKNKIVAVLNSYVDIVMAAGDPNQPTLFGDDVAPTKIEALEAAVRKVSDIDANQITLWSDEELNRSETVEISSEQEASSTEQAEQPEEIAEYLQLQSEFIASAEQDLERRKNLKENELPSGSGFSQKHWDRVSIVRGIDQVNEAKQAHEDLVRQAARSGELTRTKYEELHENLYGEFDNFIGPTEAEKTEALQEARQKKNADINNRIQENIKNMVPGGQVVHGGFNQSGEVLKVNAKSFRVRVQNTGNEETWPKDMITAAVLPKVESEAVPPSESSQDDQVDEKTDSQKEEVPKEPVIVTDRSPYEQLAFFNKKLRSRDYSANEVRDQFEYLVTNKEAVIASTLEKISQDPNHKRKRKDTKKDMADRTWNKAVKMLAYADTDVFSFPIDFVDPEASMIRAIRTKLDMLTNESIQDHLLAIKLEEDRRNKAINNPETLEELRLKKVSGADFNPDEQRMWDEFVALDLKKSAVEEAKPNVNTEGISFDIKEGKHTKTGETIWIANLSSRVDSATFKELRTKIGKIGGYWSNFKPNNGFIFKTNPQELLQQLISDNLVTTSDTGAEPSGNNGPDRSKIISRLRSVADGMQAKIDDLKAPRKTHTNRMAGMAAHALEEADKMERIQQIMRNVASGMESGEITHLDGVSARTHIETLETIINRIRWANDSSAGISYEKSKKREIVLEDIDQVEYPAPKVHGLHLRDMIKGLSSVKGTSRAKGKIEAEIQRQRANDKMVDISRVYEEVNQLVSRSEGTAAEQAAKNVKDNLEEYKRLQAMGFERVEQLRSGLREYLKMREGTGLSESERKKRELTIRESEVARKNIAGFFPTPSDIVSQMLSHADIKTGMKVLEPSAGKGNIADAIREAHSDVSLDVVEFNYTLRELLTDKGYSPLEEGDFLKVTQKYDRIIMNPPFEQSQDIIHVQHAYDLLNPGGRIVAIMSEGPFYRSDNKAESFRTWLEDLGGVSEPLSQGAFKSSERPTGVNTRLVIIDKEKSKVEPPPKPKAKPAAYEMKVDDYIRSKDAEGNNDENKRNNHYIEVIAALVEGKQVPPYVLSDYANGEQGQVYRVMKLFAKYGYSYNDIKNNVDKYTFSAELVLSNALSMDIQKNYIAQEEKKATGSSPKAVTARKNVQDANVTLQSIQKTHEEEIKLFLQHMERAGKGMEPATFIDTMADEVNKDKSPNENLGFLPSSLRKKEFQPGKSSRYSIPDAEVERRFANARLNKPRMFDKVREFWQVMRTKMREFEYLPKTPEFEPLRQKLLQLNNQKDAASFETFQVILQGIVMRLSPTEYDLFSRKVIVDDQYQELLQGNALNFGFTPELIKDYKMFLDEQVENTPAVRDAIQKRNKSWSAIKDKYFEAMSAIGVDVTDKISREDYFRHQVLSHAKENRAGDRRNKLRTPTNRGFLKARTGGYTGDINTDYLQAESEVMIQMLYDTEKAKVIKLVDTLYNKSAEFKAEAKQRNLETLQGLFDEKELDPIEYASLSGNQQNAWMKEKLGSKFITLEKVTAENGYTLWQPREGSVFFKSDMASKANDLFSEIMGTIGVDQDVIEDTIERLNKALGKPIMALGAKRKQFAIPEEVADTLDSIMEEENKGGFVKAMRAISQTFKVAVLTGPRSVIKYNMRNITSDLDKVLAGNPRSMTKMLQAARELAGVYFKESAGSPELRQYIQRGGLQNLQQVQETGDINQLRMFMRLYDKNKNKNVLRTLWDPYWRWARKATDYREAIARYANYLEYLEQIQKDGKPKNYGSSRRELVEALSDPRDKAFKMANELLVDYNATSTIGREISDIGVFPFFRWVEGNIKSTSMLFVNAHKDGALAEAVGRKLLGKAVVRSPYYAYRLGRLTLQLSVFTILASVWNHLMFPDEEEELSKEVRERLHLVFGRDKDGKVRYLDRLGFMEDYLEWFGMDNILPEVRDILDGNLTVKEVADGFWKKPINKVAQGIGPLVKWPQETLTGVSLYPDAFKPSANNEWYEATTNMFGVTKDFNYLKNKLNGVPQKKFDWQGFFSAGSDPNESAYYEVKDLITKFKKDNGIGLGSAQERTPKSNALYNYKQALRYGDEEAQNKFIEDYIMLGGDVEGIQRSIESMEPLSMLSKANKAAFISTLSDEEMNLLDRAYDFYTDTLLGE